jgi:hypothetical protein
MFFHQTDKASTLEELIQYVKLLQHQVQVSHLHIFLAFEKSTRI